jgi:glycosyltransferase involved in cell wall biosynthesis
MEALALGRPVICTRIAGIPELVDEECGWLVPAGSVEALAEAMQQALEAPAERLTRMGLAGRSRVSVVHDARRNAAELLELISSSKRSPVT